MFGLPRSLPLAPWFTAAATTACPPSDTATCSGRIPSVTCIPGALPSERSRARPAFYLAAAVVATSRVYVKIHHPSDVIAGAALGVVFARVARRVWPLR